MRVTNLIPAYALAIAALLGLTACGGGSSTQPAPVSVAPPKSLHTARTLVLGGEALFTRDAAGKRVLRDFGPCVDNAGIPQGDSDDFVGAFNFGILNDYPGTAVVVTDAFELTYVDRSTTIGNYAVVLNNIVVTGSRAVIVGVSGNDSFNAELKTLARSYGAAYSDSLAVGCPAS